VLIIESRDELTAIGANEAVVAAASATPNTQGREFIP
jgi:hypothetical protein